MSTVIDFAAHDDERLLDEAARRLADELRANERTYEARGYPQAIRARYAAIAPDGELPLALAARIWEGVAAGDPSAPLALGVAGIASLSRSRGELAAQPGAAVVAASLAAPAEAAWVPCAAPTWLAIVAPEGVAIATELRVAPASRPIGLRAAGAARVAADRCERVGDAAEAARWLVELRVLAAACMLGAARDAAAYARRYALERVAFGKPIAHHQALAFQLVDAATELDTAGLLLGAAAASEQPAAVAASHAVVAETALHVVERAVQALGGHGYLCDHPVEKRMRDVRALASLYGGAIAAERDHAAHVLALPDALELPR